MLAVLTFIIMFWIHVNTCAYHSWWTRCPLKVKSQKQSCLYSRLTNNFTKCTCLFSTSLVQLVVFYHRLASSAQYSTKLASSRTIYLFICLYSNWKEEEGKKKICSTENFHMCCYLALSVNWVLSVGLFQCFSSGRRLAALLSDCSTLPLLVPVFVH